MTGAWLAATVFGPPVAAGLAAFVYRGKAPAAAIIALNGLVPGAGLAAAGRPLLEILAGLAFAQATMASAGGFDNAVFLLPSMLFGAAWGVVHTRYNPLLLPPARLEPPRPPPPTRAATVTGPVAKPPAASRQQAAAASASTPPRPEAAAAEADLQPDEERGYAVSVRCTECGADTPVPVLARMAQCSYCGTCHLVTGHDEVLHLTIPTKVTGPVEVREAVLDHFRYLHYLTLYRRHVAPLEAAATQVSATGQMVNRPDVTAAAAAAEKAVSGRADAYRAHLATQLEVLRAEPFLAPYRHGMGTLYQAAFGRSRRDQRKELRFAIGTVEAAALATTTCDLPAMGRLSYLRALVPVARCGEAARTLPLDRDDEALITAFGDLDRKQLVRDLAVIRLGTSFSREVTAVVWRPWWTATVHAPGLSQTLLVDGAAGSVAGTAADLAPDLLVPLPAAALAPGAELRFLPMQCPDCGFEFGFDPSAVLHFCSNCHRVVAASGAGKEEVAYCHGGNGDDPGADLVPFWQFELRLRTADGRLLTDLAHLRDGIDGTLDQLGEEAAAGQDTIYLPAVRCINSRLTADAATRLFDWIQRHPPSIAGGRFGLERAPRPWIVGIEEEEARRFAPLFLVNAFVQRDIARVNVHQVEAWLFKARLETRGRLAYLPVARAVTEPFRRYVGRRSAAAIEQARGTG